MTTNTTAATTAIFSPDYEKARKAFFRTSGSFSRATAAAVVAAVNAKICTKHDAEWADLEGMLKDKTVARSAKTALRKGMNIAFALCGGTPVEGKDYTYAIDAEKLNADAFEGAFRNWQARKGTFKNIDAITVRILRRDKSIEERIKDLEKALAAYVEAENDNDAAESMIRRIARENGINI